MAIKLTINGRSTNVDAPPDTPLLWVLRDVLNLHGTKYGCGIGQCGACTVHVGGQPQRSCVTPVSAVANARITTIEGLSPDGIASAAASLARSRRAAMRLLPGRPDHVRRGIARETSEADGSANRRSDGRQSLPLRHLCAGAAGYS